jgi:hypothetical protein
MNFNSTKISKFLELIKYENNRIKVRINQIKNWNLTMCIFLSFLNLILSLPFPVQIGFNCLSSFLLNQSRIISKRWMFVPRKCFWGAFHWRSISKSHLFTTSKAIRSTTSTKLERPENMFAPPWGDSFREIMGVSLRLCHLVTILHCLILTGLGQFCLCTVYFGR